MVDTQPSSRASSSAELDAVTTAQQWLADRGLTVPSHEASSAVRATRRRGPGRRPELNDPGASGAGSTGAGSTASGSTASGSIDPASVHLDRAEHEAQARSVVLRKLSAQARTRHELDLALRAKDVPADIADQVLDRMEDDGLVDDATFAQDWVDSRQQRRQLSRRALGRELRDRGVRPDQIEDALAGVKPAQEYSSAVELAQRRHRSMGGLPREVVRRRLAGVLARRGFGSGVITRVLAEVVDARASDS